MFSCPLSRSFKTAFKPMVLSSFGLFTSSSLSRHSSSSVKRFLVRQPSPLAPREVPTPLVFLSATEWDTSTAGQDWTDWSSMLASKGYTCIEVDIRPPETPVATSEELMEHFTTQLSQQVRLSGFNPFPPVLLARSSTCLIAQAYISSHPCSALFLLSPPTSNESVPQGLLPTPLAEFDFEPRFPVGVMVEGEAGESAFQASRLGQETGGRLEMLRVDQVDGAGSNAARNELERWMDRAGI